MLNVIKYAEEIGIEKGMEKGMEKGIEKGMEKGIKEGIEGMADIKFGELGVKIMDSIKKIHDISKLENIKEAIKSANTVDDVLKYV